MAADIQRRRAFVVGAYFRNGGTYMAYHLALILHLDFGCEILVVDGPDATHGVFDYPIIFPKIEQRQFMELSDDQDILIANPSFSGQWHGFKHAGPKIMYIQGFNTFSLLDCRFDRYVAASHFVQKFIANTYGIETQVIPPFIHLDRFPKATPWRERRERSVLVSAKGDPNLQTVLLDRLRQELRARNCEIELGDCLLQQCSHSELISQFGQHRYFLTLSPAEGFGLMPLEAMAMGATVIGFDGFGGRDYMCPGVNCEVTSFADIEGLSDRIVRVFADPNRAEALAEAGEKTAHQPRFTYEHFRTCWRREFTAALKRSG